MQTHANPADSGPDADLAELIACLAKLPPDSRLAILAAIQKAAAADPQAERTT